MKLPSLGYRIGQVPKLIGICSVQMSMTLSRNDSNSLTKAATLQAGINTTALSNEVSLRATNTFYNGKVDFRRSVVPGRAILWMPFKYRDGVFHEETEEPLCRSLRRGDTFMGEVFAGAQLKVTYKLLYNKGRKTNWLDAVKSQRFLIRELSSVNKWKSFAAIVKLGESTNAFLRADLMYITPRSNDIASS